MCYATTAAAAAAAAASLGEGINLSSWFGAGSRAKQYQSSLFGIASLGWDHLS